MNYDDYKLMTPEQAQPERMCDRCGERIERLDLEVIDGWELCPRCLEDYLDEQEVDPDIEIYLTETT